MIIHNIRPFHDTFSGTFALSIALSDSFSLSTKNTELSDKKPRPFERKAEAGGCGVSEEAAPAAEKKIRPEP